MGVGAERIVPLREGRGLRYPVPPFSYLPVGVFTNYRYKKRIHLYPRRKI